MQTKISLNEKEIPLNKSYEGYLWWSNADKPEVFKNELLKSVHKLWPTDTDNPFIIEGNLWCKADHISYLIRFIDGKHLVYKFDLSQRIPREQLTFHNYLPNGVGGVRKLRFIEVWSPQPDPLCEGFEVLKPTIIAFVGFKS